MEQTAGEQIDGRILDPLVECVAEGARRYGLPFARDLLAQLPRNAEGQLPVHQAPAALELAGLNYDVEHPRRIPATGKHLPAIAALGDRRFALLLETKDDELLVWRPESGTEIWEPRSELAESYAGTLIPIHGDPDKMRADEAPWHAKARQHWFWGELRRERRAFMPVLLASLLINLLAISLPIFTMNVYDRVIPNQAQETLWVLGIGVVLAFTLEFALRRARTSIVDEIAQRLDLKLSQKIFSRLLAVPLSERKGHTGSLAARVAEYAIVRDFFASTSVVLVVDVVFLVIFVGVIAIIGGWLALVPLTIILAMMIAGYILQKKVVEASQDAQADYGLQQTLLVESLTGAETLKAMGGEGGMISRWHQLAEIGGHSQLRLRSINSLAVGLAQVFQQVSTVSLIIGGYYLFASGAITMGAIIAIVMLASRSLAPAGQIAFLLTRGRQAQETLGSIERLFEGEDERRLGASVAPAAITRPRIEFHDADFAYTEGGQPALTGLNLTIEPGERIALVGRVASGKSTLGRLLCGLYRPTSGAMLVNGIDVNQYRPQQLRDALGFVGQDAALFSGSIRDNLILGRTDISEEELLAAMRATGADAFLSRDSGGFDRAVGEDGRQLSGGQRSFLSLARAMVRPRELLFLDEPTGAMDSETEKMFVERLAASLQPERTLVIATHRPALFSICDRLIVLDRGRIAADGSVKDVLAKAGAAKGVAS
ncbi:type I secretion system permease/ATPase [Qipengyuania psychrotolerans]|uniref:Type I secretion system permease/ATPase n=1 Tax=Qipengyuania psychrotolerans TaxID=2867238 RepID=A0ABX8ZE38_9SPHN|nr:type I secretion system permease/ATPase [Qipengyuania psychrotolerans]QZD87272.1 type I secretion system permease/ATPase [Qipengyuania psychrotolerans]